MFDMLFGLLDDEEILNDSYFGDEYYLGGEDDLYDSFFTENDHEHITNDEWQYLNRIG